MNKKATFSRNIDRDVVLCETTNRVVSRHTTDLLVAGAVPFSKVWKRVPLFKRRSYNGADTVCVISISRTQYSKARQLLFDLDEHDYSRLLLNLI